jgi:hypothetical protein
MRKKLLSAALLTLTSVLFNACEKKDPPIPNEEELITTLQYTLSPIGGGVDVILKFVDLDGDGGDAPIITGGQLAANTSYTGILTLLDETKIPSEDITTEIKAEDKEHQFFFGSSTPEINVTYNDTDANGQPVGLNSSLVTGAAANGNLTITLRHEPNKTAVGVALGDITNAGGETDIEVVFPVEVK